MKLVSIKIKNYKSIEEVSFMLDYSLKEQTYALIGVNEAGKSSFLEAVSFFDIRDQTIDQRFFHKETGGRKSDVIDIIFEYEDCSDSTHRLREKLKEKEIEEGILSRIEVKKIHIKRTFKAGQTGILEIEETSFADSLSDCIYDPSTQRIILKAASDSESEFDLQQCLLENFDLLNICYSNTHKTLFWKSSSKYLIDQPVDLNVFRASPRATSVPLTNCFNLIGITDDAIPAKVDEIMSDSVARKNSIGQLEREVTTHIKNIWKEHRVKIKFDINASLLEFMVEDDGVEDDNKTTSQRSDGFRQFISFLLSISAESKTGELQNHVLLIDEPEQHLHPKAAEFLREDLIKIASNEEDNNIVFFATHSLFLIDQEILGRNYAVVKKDNKETNVEKIDGSINTYSSIVYNVFNVYTNDYHNELIGWLQGEKKLFESTRFNEYLILNGAEKKSAYIELRKDGTETTHKNISLSLYIRHQIHHPDNDKNDKFTKEELVKSTDQLVKLKAAVTAGTDKDLPAMP